MQDLSGKQKVDIIMAATTFLLFMFAVFPRNSDSKVNLGSVCQDMWNKATNNLIIPSELAVDPNQASPNVFQLIPTENKTMTPEFLSFQGALESHALKDPVLRDARIGDFLVEICKTGGPMEVALAFLVREKKIAAADRTTCQTVLKTQWSGNSQHTGFEHMFVGQKDGSTFSGFHNWYQFYLQQVKKSQITNVQFVQALKKVLMDTQPPFMSGLKFDWDGAKKGSYSTLFVGTSPAFELALFSTCFLMIQPTSKSDECECNIGKSLVKVEVYRDKSGPKIRTAFPKDVSIRPAACFIANNDRTDCGFIGIKEEECEKRGCCWSQEPGPWCFYPTGHKCHGIVPNHRKDCGYLGITRQECENSNNCCFDNHVPNVPFCFKGNP